MALHSDPLSTTFAALADPTRRAILARLAKGEASVGELGQPFAMSGPAITKHLKMLERAGLISRSRAAQQRPSAASVKSQSTGFGSVAAYSRPLALSARAPAAAA